MLKLNLLASQAHILAEDPKREKNETNEVKSGTECGISIKEFNDFKVGDFIEVFSTEEVAQSL